MLNTNNLTLNKEHLLVILLLHFFAVTLVANTPVTDKNKPDVERTYGLIVAIDEYTGEWDALKHNVNDAKAIQKVLSEKYNFDEIISLYDQEATKENIETSIDRLTKQAGDYDNILIYFAGYSEGGHKESYWIPADATTKTKETYINHKELKTAFEATKARHLLLLTQGIIDTVYHKEAGYPSQSFRDFGSPNYYSRVKNLLSRHIIMFGESKPSLSLDSEHTIMGKYLLKFLKSNKKNFLDASELFEFLQFPLQANSSYKPLFSYFSGTGHEGGQFVFQLNKEIACNFEVGIEEGEAVRFNRYGTLHARTSAPKGMQYEWLKEGKLMGKSRLLDVNRSGDYTVVATTLDGCSKRSNITVKVERVPLRVKIKESSFVEFVNTGVLHAECNQSYDIEYEWRKDNRIIGKKPYLRVYESGLYTVQAYADSGRVAGSKVTGVKIKSKPNYYKIQAGDDLQRIAEKHYKNPDKWLLIYDANKDKLGDTDILRVGQELVIPEDVELEFADEKVMRIVTGDGLPPFVDRGYYKNGVVTDVVLNVFDKMEQKVALKHLSWIHAKNATQELGYAVTFPYLKTNDNVENFYLSEPIDKMLVVWFVRADSRIDEQTLDNAEQIEKLSVAQVKGYEIDKIDEYVKKGLKVVIVDSPMEAFQLLYQGKVNFVAAGQMTGVSIIHEAVEMEQNDFRILDKSLGTHTVHLMVSKEYPGGEALVFKFNKTLEKIRNEGKLNQLQTLHKDIYQRMMKE